MWWVGWTVMSEINTQVATQDDLEAVRRSMLDEMDRKLAAQRRELEDTIKQVSQTNEDTLAAVQKIAAEVQSSHHATMAEIKQYTERLENRIINDVTAITTQMQKQMVEIRKGMETVSDGLSQANSRIDYNAEMDRARQREVHLNTANIDAVRRDLGGTGELVAQNTSLIMETRTEMSDIYMRVLPIHAEVMGDKDTGKLSLRQEWSRSHEAEMETLRLIQRGVTATNDRMTVVEGKLVAIDERHQREDVVLRKIPSGAWRLMRGLLANVFVRWLAALGLTGGALALLAELIETLFGG